MWPQPLITLEPAVVVCNNREAEVVKWAYETGVACRHLSGRTHPDPDELDQAICETLVEMQVDPVVLSGYMKMLGPPKVAAVEPQAYLSVLERIATGELRLDQLPRTPLVLGWLGRMSRRLHVRARRDARSGRRV